MNKLTSACGYYQSRLLESVNAHQKDCKECQRILLNRRVDQLSREVADLQRQVTDLHMRLIGLVSERTEVRDET